MDQVEQDLEEKLESFQHNLLNLYADLGLANILGND